MTVSEAINRFDELRENPLSVDEKIRLLSSLDMQIKNELIDSHIPNDGDDDLSNFDGYTSSDGESELIAPDAYSQMYIYFLCFQADCLLGDSEKMANDATLFDNEKEKYVRWYHSTHMVNGEGTIRI